MSVYDSLTQIARPIHVHGVQTPEAYEKLQREQINRQRTARPSLVYLDPWDVLDTVAAQIAGGKWFVRCVCGNAPSASPEWNIARCLECGAVFRNILWPQDRGSIEAELVRRRSSAQRAWNPSETVADLIIENEAMGVQ